MKIIRVWDKVTNSIYQNLGNPDFIQFAKSIKLQFEFIIEAGCHDASDTLVNLREFNPKCYLAFEPDTAAYRNAQKKLAEFPNSVILYKKAVGDQNKTVVLEFHNQPGSGSSHISDSDLIKHGERINVVRLDDFIGPMKRWGLMWLDVEGYGLPALKGATNILKNVAVAKVEVQMHDMELNRKADSFQVISIMREANLIPVYLPVHPGFFGDLYFLNRDLCPMRLKIRSAISLKLFAILHNKVYRWMKIPDLHHANQKTVLHGGLSSL